MCGYGVTGPQRKFDESSKGLRDAERSK
jgi:hypothetical protein